MFFPGSRYAAMPQYRVVRADGSVVQAVKIPLPGKANVLGYYRRLADQRLDAIAAHFLADATAFWRLCDANNTAMPDALAKRDLVGIPNDAKVRV